MPTTTVLKIKQYLGAFFNLSSSVEKYECKPTRIEKYGHPSSLLHSFSNFWAENNGTSFQYDASYFASVLSKLPQKSFLRISWKISSKNAPEKLLWSIVSISANVKFTNEYQCQTTIFARQHCRLSICFHFDWVWQIRSKSKYHRWWDEQACLTHARNCEQELLLGREYALSYHHCCFSFFFAFFEFTWIALMMLQILLHPPIYYIYVQTKNSISDYALEKCFLHIGISLMHNSDFYGKIWRVPLLQSSFNDLFKEKVYLHHFQKGQFCNMSHQSKLFSD